MQITDDLNDQLMVMAAHRYCLGRRSYIVGSCLDWLNSHWEQFTRQTRQVILRDTIEAILDECAGDEMDINGWKQLVIKQYQHGINDKERAWLHCAVSHKLDLGGAKSTIELIDKWQNENNQPKEKAVCGKNHS